MIDYVILWKTLASIQLPWLQHPQSDVHYLIIYAIDGYQSESVLRRHGVQRCLYILSRSLSIIFNQKCSHLSEMSITCCDCRNWLFYIPSITRIPYFSLISSDVSKMDGHGREKSSCVYAPTYGFSSPALTSSLSAGACVGSGQSLGSFP